jgi:hypothetical protein
LFGGLKMEKSTLKREQNEKMLIQKFSEAIKKINPSLQIKEVI